MENTNKPSRDLCSVNGSEWDPLQFLKERENGRSSICDFFFLSIKMNITPLCPPNYFETHKVHLDKNTFTLNKNTFTPPTTSSPEKWSVPESLPANWSALEVDRL